MYNWSVNTRALKKDREQYARWRLEQLINYGLGNEKLNVREVKRHWSQLHIDPKKKTFLSLLLWGKPKLS